MSEDGDLDVVRVGLRPKSPHPEKPSEDEEAQRGPHSRHPGRRTSPLVTGQIVLVYPHRACAEPGVDRLVYVMGLPGSYRGLELSAVPSDVEGVGGHHEGVVLVADKSEGGAGRLIFEDLADMSHVGEG